jgi:hypothetical protein
VIFWQVFWQTAPEEDSGKVFVLVDPTDHNPNTPPSTTPLVTGQTIRLPGHTPRSAETATSGTGAVDLPE